MRIVDLFSGIGGVAEAARELDSVSVVAAIDIDQTSNSVYSLNHEVTPLCRTLESIRKLPEGDLVWMSPPCQPYTRRGQQRGENDPRSEALTRLIQMFDAFDQRAPDALILENVPEFEDTPHHRELVDVLKRQGFFVSHQVLCPTQWGIPMRRRRFYLRASRRQSELAPIRPHASNARTQTLGEFVDEDAWTNCELEVTDSIRQRYPSAMDLVDVDDPCAVAACFTSAYGDSPVRAGSYLCCRQRNRIRRFSPKEVAVLMGYRSRFQWPEGCTIRHQYRMLGNALSVQVTRALLSSL